MIASCDLPVAKTGGKMEPVINKLAVMDLIGEEGKSAEPRFCTST